MHLLMETALSDSQHYEIISPEELDEIKRRLVLVSSHIDATKRKLVLETKLRDAAQNLNRIYANQSRENGGDGSPQSPGKKRRSIFGSRNNGSANEVLGRTDHEVQESIRKCEELAQDLRESEREEHDLRQRLLEHTAGVLQTTHKGYLSAEPPLAELEGTNGHVNGTKDINGTDFGNQSHYLPYPGTETYGLDYINGTGGPSNTEFAKQTQLIVDVESRVANLNAQLRDVIIQLRPRKEDLPLPPRQLIDDDQADPGEVLWEQVDFLERCFDLMGNLQSNLRRQLEGSNIAAEERLEQLNTNLHKVMSKSNQAQASKYVPPPKASGNTLQDQLDYLEGGLGAVDRRIQQLVEAGQNSTKLLSTYDKRAERYQSVIGGLWDIISASDEEVKQRNKDLGSTGNESAEEFSLQAFSAKVQALHARATELKEQKAVLLNQAQKQRELWDAADKGKNAQIEELTAELDATKDQVEIAIKAAQEHQDDLRMVTAELEAARQELVMREKQRGMEHSEALNAERTANKEVKDQLFGELESKQDKISQLETELQSLREAAAKADYPGQLEVAEHKLQKLLAQHEEAKGRVEVMELNAVALRTDLDRKEQSLSVMEGQIKKQEAEIVRLQTELTITKAELDSAHGSRAQRAAEAAADPALHKQIAELTERNMYLIEEIASLKAAKDTATRRTSELTSRISTLQYELGDMTNDYEAMLKASLEFDKEREHLESLIDTYRERIDVLENQLNDEKVQQLGLKSPGPPGSKESTSGGTTSTMVLKNEFKKMMRETRAEYAKAMKVLHSSTCLWEI